MAKFVEITKINSHNESGKALINIEDVVGINQNATETEKMYNENGDLVSETPKPTLYTLLLGNGKTFHIDDTQYQALVQILTTMA